MARKSQTKLKKPNATKLRTLGLEIENAFTAFENAQIAFAQLVYDAGNQDLETFSEAIEKAARGEWRTWQGRVHLNKKDAKNLLSIIGWREAKARKSTQS